jgi:chromosome segregation ATPase
MMMLLGNENEKKYIYIIIALSAVFFMLLWGSFRGIATRDYELGRTRTELQTTAERLRSANERVEQLEAGLTSVAGGLGNINNQLRENNGGLRATIERLQGIAKEVELLEDRLHNLRNNNGGCGSPSDMEL